MAAIPSSVGPYRVEHLLGEGGMGAVYAAVHTSIERRVAIKVLHPEFAVRPEFVGRLFNEARAGNPVEHPGLVQVSDYGQQPDGTAYIVMEYLRGQSLSARLQQEGALRVREALGATGNQQRPAKRRSMPPAARRKAVARAGVARVLQHQMRPPLAPGVSARSSPAKGDHSSAAKNTERVNARPKIED